MNDPEIQVFDNGAPNNLHAEPCIAAAQAGKHIICKKPLARNAAEAKAMLEAVQAAGVVHLYLHLLVLAHILRMDVPRWWRERCPGCAEERVK